MVDFMSILDQWENLGVFNILLPFLLVFAITFAVLEKISLFGTGKRQINGVIAAILGILVVRNQYVVGIINRFLPNVALFMIIILMFLLLVGTFTGNENKWVTDNLGKVAAAIAGVFVLWALSSDFFGQRYEIPSFLYGFDEQTKATILFVGVFVGVIVLVWWSGGKDKEKPTKLDLSSLGGSTN